MRVLISALGSHGDVLPFIALGQAIQARGHDVRLYTSEPFEAAVREAGLPGRSILSREVYLKLIRNPNLNHPRKGLRLIQPLLDSIPNTYQALRSEVDPGNTILITSTVGFALRFLRETDGLATAIVHLAPSMFRSEYRPPRFLGAPPKGMPRFAKRWFWQATDRFLLDPILAPELNRHRAALGLPPLKRVGHHWMQASELIVGMFPRWFAEPQPDWPSQLRLTDFPFTDHGATWSLPEDVRRFLADGEPPVAFTPGTATAASQAFFAASVEACRRAGRRGLLLTPYPEQVPSPLPPNVMHCPYAPFGALLPQVAAFVHHGGIGSTSQALRAGVPQLIRPMAHDQFDNAQRAVQLGVARELSPRRYRPQAIIKALEALTDTPTVRIRCAELATRAQQGHGIEATCDLILGTLDPANATIAPTRPAANASQVTVE